MTNAELLAKIKDFANEQKDLLEGFELQSDFRMGEIAAYSATLSFLSTLESEEPTLTWGDVQLLDTFILECAREEREGKDWGESEEFYTEVLRRYNDFVKRTIPEIVSKIHEYNENDRKDSPEN